MLQDLGSDHLPILLSVPLSPVFHPNKHLPSFNFPKAHWDDFASHCLSAEEYSSLFLSSATALFTSLALNAAKSFIPFGHIKNHPKAWWSAGVEGATLSVSLTEVMKIAKLTFLLLDVPRQSLPRPRPKHGRRFALLFHPNQTQKLYTTLLRSIIGSSSSSPNFPNCFSPRESASVYAAYLRSHFSVSQPKTLYSRARDYLSELCQATFPEESHSFFYSPFSPTEFLAAASNLFSSTATGPDKVSYPMLKDLPRSGIDFLLHIFNLSWTSHSFPSIWNTYYSHPHDGKPSRLSCFLPAYLSHLLCLKAFWPHHSILSTASEI